jgi:hypothetical protein
MDLNSFLGWQAEDTDRHVDIEIKSDNGKQVIKIWVYDYHLQEGSHVQSVDDIDLHAVKEAKERAKLAELQQKYGG